MPLMTLISVLLPAPFSPISACTSPLRSEKPTPWSATTPAKRLVICWARRTMSPGSAITLRSILPRRQQLFGLLLREDPFLHHHALGHFLLGRDLFRDIEQLRPEQRIAFDGAVQLPIHHRLKCVLDRVDRDDLDVHAGLLARGLDRLDRAQRHVVVVRVQRRDLRSLRTL